MSDHNARIEQIRQFARELALVLRSDATPTGEMLAKIVEGVAKAACGE